MTTDQMLSADCHVVEPPDLFTSRVPARYRDAAPKTVWGPLSDGREGEFYGLPGALSDRDFLAVSSLAAAGLPDMMEANREGFQGLPLYVRDPAARIEVQEHDGVQAEVLYPSWGMFVYSIQDDGLRRACFAAYNDWVAEFCGYNSKRLLGSAGIDVAGPESVADSAAELLRCTNKGLRPALIPCDPGPGFNYGMPAYDRLWAAAQDCEMPISLHILCNKDVYPFTSGGPGDSGPFDYVNTIIFRILSSVTHMIAGGVFDRFPKLKLVVSEADCSWIPHFLFRLDHFYGSGMGRQLPLEMKPSDYFRRNCYATFQWEGSENLPYVIDFIGADRLCWGSDFPHFDSTFPNSKAVVGDALSRFSEETRRTLVHGTMAQLYNL